MHQKAISIHKNKYWITFNSFLRIIIDLKTTVIQNQGSFYKVRRTITKKFFKIPQKISFYAKDNNIREIVLNKITQIIAC
jgi:hypothetical protein